MFNDAMQGGVVEVRFALVAISTRPPYRPQERMGDLRFSRQCSFDMNASVFRGFAAQDFAMLRFITARSCSPGIVKVCHWLWWLVHLVP